MAVDRRKFLGAAAGAVAAAPAAAQDAFTVGKDGVAMSNGKPVALAPWANDPWANDDRTAGLLKTIQRVARGDVNDEDLSDFSEPFENSAVLKSVSAAGKLWMLRNERARRERRELVERAIRVLAEYDRTGIVSHLYNW